MKKPVKKSLKTKSKVQTVTTRQILTATFALLLANGFALASLPSKNVGIAPLANCPIRLTKSYFCQVKKGISGYRQFTYTCPSGKSFQISGSCRTEESILAMATKVCKESKLCVAPKAPLRLNPIVPKVVPMVVTPKTGSIQSKSIVAAPTPYSDVAFIGRPEENVTFSVDKEKNYEVTVEYINRGPGDLQVVEDELQRSKISLTLLDKNQQPILFEPETFIPVLAKGEQMKTVFRLSSLSREKVLSGEAEFVKVELKVGERKIGGLGAFDPDIENNVTIVPVTSFSVLK